MFYILPCSSGTSSSKNDYEITNNTRRYITLCCIIVIIICHRDFVRKFVTTMTVRLASLHALERVSGIFSPLFPDRLSVEPKIKYCNILYCNILLSDEVGNSVVALAKRAHDADNDLCSV